MQLLFILSSLCRSFQQPIEKDALPSSLKYIYCCSSSRSMSVSPNESKTSSGFCCNAYNEFGNTRIWIGWLTWLENRKTSKTVANHSNVVKSTFKLCEYTFHIPCTKGMENISKLLEFWEQQQNNIWWESGTVCSTARCIFVRSFIDLDWNTRMNKDGLVVRKTNDPFGMSANLRTQLL